MFQLKTTTKPTFFNRGMWGQRNPLLRNLRLLQSEALHAVFGAEKDIALDQRRRRTIQGCDFGFANNFVVIGSRFDHTQQAAAVFVNQQFAVGEDRR